MKAAGKRTKGSNFERMCVKRLEGMGLQARRQPLSGALQDFPHDIQVHVGEKRYIIECKKHKSALKTIRTWLGRADMLFHGQDFERDFLVTMPFSVFEDLIGRDDVADKGRAWGRAWDMMVEAHK